MAKSKPSRAAKRTRGASSPRVVKGMPSVALSEAEFRKRFLERFYDPGFEGTQAQLDAVARFAWESYHEYRKSPRTKAAGPGFAKPAFELPVEWLEARRSILKAERARKVRNAPSRILLINGSSRSDQSCPGEMSKTYRLAALARRASRPCGESSGIG